MDRRARGEGNAGERWTERLRWLLPPEPGTMAAEASPAETGSSRRRESERGFALVVALVAMTALTVLGVAAVTSSSIDLKAAHNMRRWEQARYAALAGAEHARRNLVMNIWPAQDEVTYFDETDATPAYYIDETEAMVMTSSAGEPLGTYVVEAVAVKCGGPPPGYSVEQFYSQFFDLRSTGVIKDEAGVQKSPATSSTALTVRKVKEGRCYKR